LRKYSLIIYTRMESPKVASVVDIFPLKPPDIYPIDQVQQIIHLRGGVSLL
jgi:hypothetical protein